MKANELMIGGLVEVFFTEDETGFGKDYYAPILAIQETKVIVKGDHHWHPIDKIRPIPLTPEILEKCGFKKYSHEPGYKFGNDFEKEEKCDEYSCGKLTIMDWGNGLVLSNSFSFTLRVELKHLHQLQNLYFALTGTELIINL